MVLNAGLQSLGQLVGQEPDLRCEKTEIQVELIIGLDGSVRFGSARHGNIDYIVEYVFDLVLEGFHIEGCFKFRVVPLLIHY